MIETVFKILFVIKERNEVQLQENWILTIVFLVVSKETLWNQLYEDSTIIIYKTSKRGMELWKKF